MDGGSPAEIETLIASLSNAWNAGDGAAFARSFCERADFVNIYAMHFVGREAIAKQHQTIFDGVYLGSHVTFTIEKTRTLAESNVLAWVVADLRVPQGPLKGDLRARATILFAREAEGWCITAFHNTLETAPPGARQP